MRAGRKEGPSVAAVADLRKSHPAAHVHAALLVARAQAKARGKFPQLPVTWATPEALEQASGTAVARFKAARFLSARPSRIVDLCSGIGGDALALAAVAPVTAIDLSPVRIACLAFNAAGHLPPLPHAVEGVVGDVDARLTTLPGEALFHIDPARRSGGRRTPHYEDLIPGPAVLERVIAHFRGGGLKLSPAVDFSSLPAGHVELLSDRGSVVQAVLWTGVLADLFPSGTRTASCLSREGTAFSYTAVPRHPTLSSPSLLLMEGQRSPAILYELDGALTRAGLAAAFADEHRLTPLTPDGGYLLHTGSDIPPPHPVLTGFRVEEWAPFNERRITQLLSQLPPTGPGPVEVKTRGSLPGVDPDRLQAAWSKASRFQRTVLLFPSGGDTLAAIAQRVADPVAHTLPPAIPPLPPE